MSFRIEFSFRVQDSGLRPVWALGLGFEVWASSHPIMENPMVKLGLKLQHAPKHPIWYHGILGSCGDFVYVDHKPQALSYHPPRVTALLPPKQGLH